jgi:hypothetical protein
LNLTATGALRVYRVLKSNGNVSFVGLHGIGLLAIWKPCVPNRTALGLVALSDELLGDAKAGWKCPPLLPRTFMRIRPRKDRDGFDLISDCLRRGPIWYAGPDAVRYAIAYAKYRSRSRWAIIRVFDEAGKVTETHKQ